MAQRTAQTRWSGGLQDGKGVTTLVSSGLGSYDVSFPTRTAETANGATSPEELLAAAHSACYSMQLSAFLAEAGGTVENITTDAEVGVGADPAGGFKLTGITLTVRATVPGLSAEQFAEAAEKAKTACPVSKALTGVTITLDAALA
ncbi:MAG: peroxiredoxin [Actinobacteria bacterium 69-20]|nr:OsmC family peroxiredoxin [Actinomycetota bacterium]OJV26286.1 MAG: peroxiredoxin [Actinobacteria bacterium 69-20]